MRHTESESNALGSPIWTDKSAAFEKGVLMDQWFRKLLLGALLLMGFLGSAHAVYVGGNPLSYTDPEGLAPKGIPRNAIDLIPLEGGGGGIGGPSVGGISPFGGTGRMPASTRIAGPHSSAANPQCPPEVQGTLARIRSGQGFPHRNDGTVFQNREGVLPAKPIGYYREWVHPTPGVAGPGSQRVVTGQGGEAYYTPDHYRTFIPLP